MIIPGGRWRGASASQVWKLPAGARGLPWLTPTMNFSISDGESSVPERGPGLFLGEWGARPRGSRVLVPVCGAGASPARWPVMLPIPPPTPELRTAWVRGLGSSRDDAGMPCRVPVPVLPSRREHLPSRKPSAPLRHGAGPFPLPTAEWLIPPLSGGLITGKIEALFPRPSQRAN